MCWLSRRSPCLSSHRPPRPRSLRRDVIASAGLGHRDLAQDDLQHQGRLALGCPTLDHFVHRHSHPCSPRTITPEQVFSGSLQWTVMLAGSKEQ